MQNPMNTLVPCEESGHMPTLHLVCGKIAAGKSTLTKRLAMAPNTVLICEDEWLGQLYPGEISSLQDYVRLTARLRQIMGKHIEGMLRAGISVVLDFPANTPATRKWMREIFINAGSAHALHYLDVSDEQCKARLRQRNQGGAHQFNTSDAEFDEITKYFVPPSIEEGFFVIKEK
ncbi:ATP-binding protein [Undibacterium sp.]|jgi:predicted kinase|uniref:AAA family ATPase n=1 Tax=Undibacterium sp. TaxID=1914977 RepID=UPI002CC18ACF|nr:ATP-binding protein [Undibacterium sp.]HTD06617.1 ATP-binding protein [Undibacterium sp.]